MNKYKDMFDDSEHNKQMVKFFFGQIALYVAMPIAFWAFCAWLAR